ncbi:MAG TPA: cysteine hydrolase [Actinomycetales bacterium]|nr:cysteine hydrolase [Actinomycetales bacterium]
MALSPDPAPAEGDSEGDPWLVVVDPQRIFADPASEWGSPMWADALANIRRLLERFEGRTILTRWVPPVGAERTGSWVEYMRSWPFADRDPEDPYLEVVDELAGLPVLEVSAPTFGKWEVLEPITGPTPSLVLTGVSTDCCVVSTALPAADAGATIRLVTDACAGSTPENHAAAVQVMGLYPPQIALVTTDEVLGE